MGLLRRLADAFDPPREKREDPSWKALAGQAPDYAGLLGGSAFDRRPAISAQLAETLSVVTACIQAIAGATSSLPVWVYLKTDEGRQVDDAHPVASLIRNGPNVHQSFPELIEWLVSQALGHGNGLLEIITDGRGEAEALRPIPWPQVTLVLLPSGRLAYDVVDVETHYGGTGKRRRLLEDEVLHLKDRSDNGLIGRSRLERCGPPIRTGLKQEAFGEHLYENQAMPSGMLSLNSDISPEEAAKFRETIQGEWSGIRQAGKVILVTGDAKYHPFTISPESLEMLAARRFSTEEVARIYQVPPPIVGIWDHSTFTNSETAGRWFAQFCLAPWLRKLEEAFRRSVFTAASRETHQIEFDMTGFLRGDAEARWKAHEIAVRNNILTPNEVREVEGWNPLQEQGGTGIA